MSLSIASSPLRSVVSQRRHARAPALAALKPSTGARSHRRLRRTAARCSAASLEDESSLAGLSDLERGRRTFWKFLRPHTIRGTVLGSCSVTLRAAMEAASLGVPFDVAALLPKAAVGVACLLCGNGYIVGINQVHDVDLDKVNKPFLPIAAGDLSLPAAYALCAAMAATGIWLAATQFSPLIAQLYAFGLCLGTAYSVPPLYLKRFPVAAFAIIATVRGFLLNFGVYSAARAALALPFQWTPTIAFATAFMTSFAAIIAVAKDLPDIDGDRKGGVSTFSVQLGAEKLSTLVAGALGVLYVACAALPFLGMTATEGAFRPLVMGPLHATVAVLVAREWQKMKALEFSRQSVKAFYRFIWSIFYLEYACLPFLAPL